MSSNKVTVEVVYRVRCGKHTVVTNVMSVDMTLYPDDVLSDQRFIRGRELALTALAEPRDHQERHRLADCIMSAVEDVLRRNKVDP